jgi:guanine deaminase
MTDEQYMQLAIQEARESEKVGGAPIGAIIVKNGEVIAKGWSLVWPEKDPTAHGESNCIKAACKKLQTLDLSGCIMYGTLESCSMCLACASWAGLSEIVFGAYREDIRSNPYEVANYHAEEWGKKLTPPNGKTIVVRGGVLRKECADLMKNVENWSPVV